MMSFEKISAAVDAASVDELRSAVKALAREDGGVGIRLLALLGKADFESALDSLHQEMNGLWVRAENRGFVDDEKAFFFECDLTRAVVAAVDPFLKSGRLLEAHALSCEALVIMQDYVVDESGDFTGGLTSDILDCWREVLSLSEGSPAEVDIRARVFAWADSFVRDNPGSDESGTYDVQSDMVIEFLEDMFPHA